MAKSARVDLSQKTYEQLSMDRIMTYHNMAKMGFTPLKAKKLNLQKEAAMRTAVLDSTLDVEGILDTVTDIPGTFKKSMTASLKKRPSNPRNEEYKARPSVSERIGAVNDTFFSDNNYFVQQPE